MNLSLRPDLERFIDDMVKAGRFPTPEAVIESALADMADASAPLNDETVAAINQAEAQTDRNEGMDLDAFRAQMEKRIAAN